MDLAESRGALPTFVLANYEHLEADEAFGDVSLILVLVRFLIIRISFTPRLDSIT